MEIDSVQTERARTLSLGRRGGSLIAASAETGISYATAWVVGLAVWPRRPVVPRWLGYTAAQLTVALIASGAGYLLLNTTLAQAALVSGALLLVWVTGAGVALAWTSRSGAPA